MHTKHFKALFSATFNIWTIKTDEFEIKMSTLVLDWIPRLRPLKLDFQEIVATEVDFELLGKSCILLRVETIKKEKLWEIYNPDQPRNLAKTVTVK